MNAPVTFNTLAFAKKLETFGIEPRHAQGLAEALNELVFDTVASKSDIKDLRQEIRESELRLKHDLTVRMGAVSGGFTTLNIAVIGALMLFK